MYICAVKGCGNYKSVCKIGDNDFHITMHRIPKQQELREQWMKFCCQDKLISPSSRLCSEHFSEDDFIGDLKFKMGFIKARTIKKNAVPSIFEPAVRCEPISSFNEKMSFKYKKIFEIETKRNESQKLEYKNDEDLSTELETEFESFVVEPQDCALLETHIKTENIINTQSFNQESLKEQTEDRAEDFNLDELEDIFESRTIELEEKTASSEQPEPLTKNPIDASKKYKRISSINTKKTIPAKRKRPTLENDKFTIVALNSRLMATKEKSTKITECSTTAEESFLVDELENIVLEKIKKNLAEMRLETERLVASEEALQQKANEMERESKALQKEIKHLEERLKIVQENKQRLMITDKNVKKSNAVVIEQHISQQVQQTKTADFKTEFEQFIGLN